MTGNRCFLRLGELSDASVSGLVDTGFELLDFNYSLYQGVDERGRAQTDVRINGLDLLYDGLPSYEMIDWALNAQKYYSGALVLLDANDMPIEKIFFEDGACIRFAINYVADGDTYASTKITVSPRVLKMGDDTLTQPWTMSSTSTYLKKTLKGMSTIQQPTGRTNAFLVINGKDYELSLFELVCQQKVDHKGEPSGDTEGGMVSFTIAQMPDEVLRKWMIRSDKLMSGEFHFRMGDQSMPLRVVFESAFCVSMNPHKNPSGGDIRTSFVISANELTLNEKSVYNAWRL